MKIYSCYQDFFGVYQKLGVALGLANAPTLIWAMQNLLMLHPQD